MTDASKTHLDTLVVDIDGTLCPIKKNGESYADLEPYAPMIKKLKEYQAKGFIILLYTARNMRTHDNNLGRINKHTVPVLFTWLEKWQIPYDEILFGKPWPAKNGFYVDDRSVRPREFLTLNQTELDDLMARDRDI